MDTLKQEQQAKMAEYMQQLAVAHLRQYVQLPAITLKQFLMANVSIMALTAGMQYAGN